MQLVQQPAIVYPILLPVPSPIGRTKTSPAAQDSVQNINLAVYSCSNYPFGFFNAFGNPVRKDSVDYVLHLGDYIYEYKNGDYVYLSSGWGNSIGRVPLPGREIYTLYDYRKRLATYRTDLDLLANHEKFAWIPVWDDHDNTYRDGSSELNNTEVSFINDGGVSVDQRKMNAVRAYFEWMPIRQADMDDNLRIWRNFKLGNPVDLIMLDTRNYNRSITDLYWNTDYVHELSNDAGRSMMGARQEIFSHIDQSVAYGDKNPLNYDQWDGYQANRNRTLKTLYDNKIENTIMIAGSVGVEFAGTAISSPSPYGQSISIELSVEASKALIAINRELQWSELYYRGYFELHITPKEVEAQYFGMPTIMTRNPGEISLANFTVKSGDNHLYRGVSGVAGGVVVNGALKSGQTIQIPDQHHEQHRY
ncbi:hypothetical protein DTO280E4_9283 [Paecilomyces variotii]|nr:hypothetical protein DTO280E4_9283 [Paecilomyces variotii]